MSHRTDALPIAWETGPGGQLRVRVAQTFPLAGAAEAHHRLEQRQTQGKLILLPAA
jgi:NADPH:quinone reductase-like Zn-dependent oxidoreductase